MRRLILLLPCFLLLACSGSGAPPTPVTDTLVRAVFPRGGVAGVITIEARDRLPLRAAALVSPDGTTTPASSLDAVATPNFREGQQTQKASWIASRFDAENAGLQTGAPVAAFRSDTQLLLTISTAEITLPDPVAYERDWAAYKVRLSFDAGGGQLQIRDIPAPEPPPR